MTQDGHWVGPDERALFEDVAMGLYEEIARGASPGDEEGWEPRLVEARDLLVRLGLLVHSSEGWAVVDPGAVASNVVSPLSQRAADMMVEATGWGRSFSQLASAWRRAPAEPTGGVVSLRGEAIEPAIAALVADAEDELLTAQPQAGRRASTLAAAARRDAAALGRGVRMRTLYQHSARRNRSTHAYVAEVTAHGAEVRTLDEFFNRLIVVDRRVAVIPSAEGTTTAVVVREPNVVAYLVDMFERSWERGRPFESRDEGVTRVIAAEQRAMTIRMLIAGHADPASAKRLGVSPRTYAGYVADLKAEYDVRSRFQLGWEMGRRGVSGDEDEGGA